MTVTDRLYVSQIEMPNDDIYMSNGQRWLKMVSYDQFEKLEKENKELRASFAHDKILPFRQ